MALEMTKDTMTWKQRKGTHHSRFDIRHSQWSIHQINPESVRKSLHGSFRCAR